MCPPWEMGMTNDNAPQIGGQGDDNAPMISGMPNKAIVTARGAYIAGNLYALVDLMDSEQKNRFRDRLVREALRFTVSAAPPMNIIMDRFRESVERWLHNQTPHIADEALAILGESGLDDEDIYDYIIGDVMNPEFVLANVIAQCISNPNAAIAADTARELEWCMPFPQPIVVRWQREVAWAILQGKEPLSIEETP